MCGPVLFVDGDPAKEYLSFGFTPHDERQLGDPCPRRDPPERYPGRGTRRDVLGDPTARRRPAGNGGLLAPDAPAAPANVLTKAIVTPPAGTQPITAIIGSYSGGITITDIGRVSRYGQGDDARSAPPTSTSTRSKSAAAAANNGTVKDLTPLDDVVDRRRHGTTLPVPGTGRVDRRGDSRYGQVGRSRPHRRKPEADVLAARRQARGRQHPGAGAQPSQHHSRTRA